VLNWTGPGTTASASTADEGIELYIAFCTIQVMKGVIVCQFRSNLSSEFAGWRGIQARALPRSSTKRLAGFVRRRHADSPVGSHRNRCRPPRLDVSFFGMQLVGVTKTRWSFRPSVGIVAGSDHHVEGVVCGCSVLSNRQGRLNPSRDRTFESVIRRTVSRVGGLGLRLNSGLHRPLVLL